MNPVATHRGTVLLVDDAPASLSLISAALDEAGYRVLVAVDGHSALNQVELLRPDAVLLDVMMPELDGFEVCRRLQAAPQLAGIPIIFMTGLNAAMDIERAFGEGAVDYIVKPVDERELLARLSAHINKALHIRRTEASVRALGGRAFMCQRDGTVTWSTGSARAILESQWGRREPFELPAQVVNWLEGLRPESRDAQCNAPCLKLDRPDGRIHLHHVGPGVGEELLLVLEVEQPRSTRELQEAFGLTLRESEVLVWVARGKTNRDIAEILGLSPKTVNKHLEHLFVKLGVETRSAATARALPYLAS